jgi:hypothetical protein
MRTAVAVGACAALLTVGARAEAPAPDLEVEIAWARATWPDSFDGLHFHAPLAKLRAWVAHGPVPVFVFNDEFACQAATLFPYEAWRHEDVEPGEVQRMTAKVVGRPRVDEGRTVREVRYVTVDFELSREDSSELEVKGQDGRWHYGGGSGYGFTMTYGALSFVDEHVARWGGDAQLIRPYCSGPVEWLACENGGERPCVRCEQVTAMVVSPGSLYGHHVSHGNRPVTCHDACPRYPESPSLARLSALSGRVSLWSLQKAPLSAVPGLYKSREDCLREHFQGRSGPMRWNSTK